MDALTLPLDAMIEWLEQVARPETFFAYGFNVRAFFAIIIVSVICGAIGSQVVGNRMSFFSDALAHCAFAGFALALILFLAIGLAQQQFQNWMMLMMVVSGVVIGLLIAFVQERTGLPNDTVIGVFFAGAIGLGAVVIRLAPSANFNIEQFLFGQPAAVRTGDLIFLLLLLLVTMAFLAFLYNHLVLASVNPSLALSRNVSVRLCKYTFVVLLGLVVNLCLFVVGTLLINALLIVPAAAAANFCRNLRQLFWWSIGLALFCGLGGLFLSWELSMAFGVQLGAGGTIVVLTVLVFIGSMLFGPAWRNRALATARR